MAKNYDLRIPSDPPSDAGFEINLQNLNGGPSPSLVGNQAGGEGYYGDDEKLHYYVLEVVGGRSRQYRCADRSDPCPM